MSQNNKDHSMEEVEEIVVLPDEESIKDPNEDIPFVPYKEEDKSSLLEKDFNEEVVTSESIGFKKVQKPQPEIVEHETAIKFSTDEEKNVEKYSVNDLEIEVEHEEGILEVPTDSVSEVEEETDKTEETPIEEPISKPKEKRGFFAGLFKKRKKKNKVSDETEAEDEETSDNSVTDEDTETVESNENVTGESETLDSDPTDSEQKEEVEESLGRSILLNKSEEDVHIEPTNSDEDDIEVIDSGEASELEEEKDLSNDQLVNEEEPSIEEVSGNPENPDGKKQKKKKKIFFIVAGFLVVAIITSGSLLLIKDEDGKTLLSQILGKEEPLTSQPTIPVNNNNDNAWTGDGENPFEPNLPVEEPVTEEEEEIGIQDSHTEAISQALIPILEPLKGSVDSVEKYNGTIRVNATIKKGDILDINRMIRMAQIETYPYLIGDLKSTQVFVTFGKNIYSFETSKTVIEFIAKLNYEDRHSAQMWWQKTRAYKNGVNIKASLVKDRLYVEYLHPIFPELSEEQVKDESGVKEGDTTGNSEDTSSYDKNNNADDENAYTDVTTKSGTATLVYPKDIKKEIKNSSSAADGVTSNVTKSDTLGSEFGFIFTEMSPEAGEESKFSTALDQAFSYYTDKFEDNDSSLKVVTSKENGTTFEGVKYIARVFESKTNDKHIFTTFAVFSANDKVYTYVVNHPKQDDFRVAYMLKSVKFNEKEEKSDTPSKETKPSGEGSVTPASSFIGDKSTKMYYPADSEKAKAITEANKVIFISKDQASAAGFEVGK